MGKARVLVYTEAWMFGGIESFLMSVLRNIPREEFDIEIVSTWGDPSVYEEALNDLGVRRRVLFAGSKPGLVRRTIGGLRQFREALNASRYDAVHVNTMNGFGFAYTWLASRAGVPIRIAHSHNSWFGEGLELPKRALHLVGRALFGRSANVRLACSEEAGRHLFGKDGFTLVRNGVDTERFAFDAEKRRVVRRELGISDEGLLVGAIGRVSAQKDPVFQLEVFSELQRIEKDSIYLMVGGDEFNGDIELIAEELGVGEALVRIDATPEPERYLSSLDAFLFPSVYEGLGIAAVEAQCNGLPVLAADHLPHEVAVTDLVIWLDKGQGARAWAEKLIESRYRHISREAYASVVEQTGYSARSTAAQMRDFYNGCNN